jgi:hypothetical protein
MLRGRRSVAAAAAAAAGGQGLGFQGEQRGVGEDGEAVVQEAVVQEAVVEEAPPPGLTPAPTIGVPTYEGAGKSGELPG